VVFVDLDRDEVLLGMDEDQHEPRQKPRMPDREAYKLRSKLMVGGGGGGGDDGGSSSRGMRKKDYVHVDRDRR